MNRIEEIFQESSSGTDYARRYTGYVSELLAGLDFGTVNRVIEVFKQAREDGRTIFFIGNGGSAATCSHFVEDLAQGTLKDGMKPFKALSLTDNIAYITALGNDEGYDNIFTAQLKVLFQPGDVVVAISVSGNSSNVIKAIEYANSQGGISIGFAGFDGGKMKEICQYCIHVETNRGEYGPAEDVHLILSHLVATYFKFKIAEES